jgi:hypothetical protein
VPEPVNIETIRAEALRKLGRNIVNFSKIEGGFKLLLSVSQVSGTKTTLSGQVLANQRRLRKKTLGRLVTAFNQNIMGDTDEAEPPETLSEPWMSISFKVVDSDPDFSKAQRQKLAALVAERNRLIHQDLAYLDTSSVEDYCKLINLLDEQNPRLLAHLDDLKWMLESLRETLQEIPRSPEFAQLIQSLNR